LAMILQDNAYLESCIKRLAQGERDAFRALYDAIKDSVFRFALSICKNHHLAEDILQESMLKFIGNAGAYNPGTNPKAWCLSITRNLCLDALKKSSRKDVALEDVANTLQTNDDFTFALESENEAVAALQVLTQEQREIVSLYVFSGLRQPEIATTLEIPYIRVRSQYKYALKKLRDYYKSKLE